MSLPLNGRMRATDYLFKFRQFFDKDTERRRQFIPRPEF